MRTSSRRVGAEVENAVFAFSKARQAPSSALTSLDARVPNHFFGLAFADHGQCRAALDVNDFRILRVGAQHPEKSYRQSARRCDLGYAFRHAVAAVQVLLAKSFIQSCNRLCTLYEQCPHEAITLLVDCTQPLFASRAMFAWNQPQIARHLLATFEA
jgi:hypothetical protein